jgi:hypothetical protein
MQYVVFDRELLSLDGCMEFELRMALVYMLTVSMIREKEDRA